MPQQPDSATPTRVCGINESLLGQKLRIAGRVLSYDVLTGLFVLLDNDKAVMVDVSMAIDDKSKLWATERLSTVIVLGHLEGTEQDHTVPQLPRRIQIHRHLVIRALLVVPCMDLNLALWNAVVAEGECS
ncbi:hypothetical protein K443DRAFT_671644 [Laccaria amethystina LaAM-08-1]|uniref:Uncharacterized protein n=1 Tax=Laccaria amethystina LaAM-08-1 TaxID=1095629 RepID=A0A0C9YME4_9AGAR|nr:hypothetical protein K443DRAFT_671644 [Laccaria amethystina LaAM-08-1]